VVAGLAVFAVFVAVVLTAAFMLFVVDL